MRDMIEYVQLICDTKSIIKTKEKRRKTDELFEIDIKVYILLLFTTFWWVFFAFGRSVLNKFT